MTRGNLILNRKCGDKVLIGPPDGPQVVLTVLEIRGHSVRLGVLADPETTIHKGETVQKEARRCSD